jgi:hypothetical protein
MSGCALGLDADDVLTAFDQNEKLAHIRECAACRQVVALRDKARAAWTADAPREDVTPAENDEKLRRIWEGSEPPRAPRLMFALPIAVVAALVLALAFRPRSTEPFSIVSTNESAAPRPALVPTVSAAPASTPLHVDSSRTPDDPPAKRTAPSKPAPAVEEARDAGTAAESMPAIAPPVPPELDEDAVRREAIGAPIGRPAPAASLAPPTVLEDALRR